MDKAYHIIVTLDMSLIFKVKRKAILLSAIIWSNSTTHFVNEYRIHLEKNIPNVIGIEFSEMNFDQ